MASIDQVRPISSTMPTRRLRPRFTGAVLGVLLIAVLYPLWEIVSVSVADRHAILSGGGGWTLRAYREAWSVVPFPRYFLNSMIVSGIVTLGSTLSAVLAAYVFARATFPGRDLAFLAVVGTLMIPSHITLIPNYLTFAQFQALDSYAALILPFLASGFSVFFLRQYMMGIPIALDEAARMDGASRWFILWTIIVPMSWPAIVVVALFSFLGQWNEFIWPLLSTTSEDMRTVQIGLRYLYRNQAEGGAIDWPLVMAGSVITLAPLLLAFVLAERHLIRGITMGSFR